jgi:16S rRNA (adenine1518-N6/adenine1519-N6)-dimethyltransferase
MGVSVRELLDRHSLRLSRERGQNFLIDDRRGEQLAALAGVRAEDTVIEVGTGLGALTRGLAARAARVVTIEVDSGLVRALRTEALLPANVELLHADANQLDWPALLSERAAEGPIRVVANLPYSVATPLLRRLLDLRDQLVDWSIALQREVAARMSAEVGSRDFGSLSVLHGLTVDVQRTADLPPGNFFPAPRVQSSFVRVTPKRLRDGEPVIDTALLLAIERVARAAFNQRRKTIENALRGAGDKLVEGVGGARALLERAGVDPKLRAEQVPLDRWLALGQQFALCEKAEEQRD